MNTLIWAIGLVSTVELKLWFRVYHDFWKNGHSSSVNQYLNFLSKYKLLERPLTQPGNHSFRNTKTQLFIINIINLIALTQNVTQKNAKNDIMCLFN